MCRWSCIAVRIGQWDCCSLGIPGLGVHVCASAGHDGQWDTEDVEDLSLYFPIKKERASLVALEGTRRRSTNKDNNKPYPLIHTLPLHCPVQPGILFYLDVHQNLGDGYLRASTLLQHG